MRLQRTKLYKDVPPYRTVNNARTLLEKCDIFMTEKLMHSCESDTYMCKVWIADEDIFDIGLGTYGKGVSPRYALASAYGEIMERIPHLVIFPNDTSRFLYTNYPSKMLEEDKEKIKEMNINLDYRFFPDEKWLTINEAIKESEKYIQEIYPDIICEKKETEIFYSEFAIGGLVPCVPFYDYFEERTVYIPIQMIYTSSATNGMSAGNDAIEAIIEGMSEIYERYATHEVYFNNIPVPSIPEEYFEGHEVLTKLRNMRKKGYDFDILDFSCGKGLPVIALKLIRLSDGAMVIRPGSDPSPITALERCLTEIYQTRLNRSVDFRFRKQAIKIPTEMSGKEELIKFYENYDSLIHSCEGDWPDNIHTYNKNPGFNGFDHSVSDSNASDFRYMVSIAKQLNKRILIRDCSFLGFPSYYTVIPGMSGVYLDKGQESIYVTPPAMDRVAAIMCKIPTATLGDVKELKSYFLKEDKRKYTKIIPASFIPFGVPLLKQTLDIKEFIKSLDEHINYLETGSGKTIFTKECWPICYNCNECKFSNNCKQLEMGKRIKSIFEQFKNNIPSQSKEMFNRKMFKE